MYKEQTNIQKNEGSTDRIIDMTDGAFNRLR